MKKTFVLDTNVLLHNSNCIESFADNTVVIPMAVIEELDKFKSNNDDLVRNARQVIRRLDRLRKQGRLGEGVPMENGGTCPAKPWWRRGKPRGKGNIRGYDLPNASRHIFFF